MSIESESVQKQQGRRGPKPRPDQDIVSLQIEDFPGALKARIIARADTESTNMNDVAVAILAKKFKVAFMPSGKQPPVQAGGGGAVALKMPRLLRKAIKTTAVAKDLAARDVVIGILDKEVK